MEARLTRVESKMSTFTNRLDDQEARSRRDNLRIFGVKEGVEGANAITYFEKWLPSLLNMKTKNGRICCRRSLGEPTSGSPRAVVMKLHYLTDKREVLALSGRNKQIFFEGALITIRQDVPQNVRQQRRSFNEVSLRFTYENRRFSFDSAEEALKVVSAIGAYYVTSVVVNGIKSSEFCLQRSTKQGDPISPLIFTLVIEPLAEAIRNNQINCKYLGSTIQTNGQCTREVKSVGRV
ncbi:paired mesoderm homeobox protein 2 [Sarotherodon galilaeus]